MAIQNVGPGGVSASFGRRETSGSKYDLTKKYGDIVSEQGDPDPGVGVTYNPLTKVITGDAAGAVANTTKTQRTSGSIGLFANVFNTTTASYTPHMQIPAQAPFYGVQIGVDQKSTSDVTVGACKVASVPIDGANSNTISAGNWVPVTWGGSATPTFTAVAAAARANDVVPSLYQSDVIFVSSVARTDFPAEPPLLQTVLSFSTAGTAAVTGSNAFAEILAASGLRYRSRIATSDIATNPSAASSTPAANGTFVMPRWARFLYSVPSRIIADVGDSRMRDQIGNDTATGWNSCAARVCWARSSQSFVWSPMSFAVTGQRHTASYMTGKQVVSVIRPDYLISEVYSANDSNLTSAGPVTQVTIDRAWAETVDLSNECAKYGVIHIVKTCPPFGLASGEDAFRLQINARLKASGMIVADVAAPLESTLDRRLLNPAFDGGDGIHLNEAGYVVERDVLNAVIPRF